LTYLGVLGRLAPFFLAVVDLSTWNEQIRSSSTLIRAPELSKLPTVVGRREDGDQLALAEELIAVLDDLVGAADQVELIDLEEIGDHVHSEEVADAALAVGPALHLLDGVGPEQVAEQA
jgi:hypothetical protein